MEHKPCLDKCAFQHIKTLRNGSTFKDRKDFLAQQEESLMKIYNLAKEKKIQFFTSAITESETLPFDKDNQSKVNESYSLFKEMNLIFLETSFMLDDPLSRMGYEHHVLGDQGERDDLKRELLSIGVSHADMRHIANAESRDCTHFITTDNRLIETIGKKSLNLKIKVVSPKEYVDNMVFDS